MKSHSFNIIRDSTYVVIHSHRLHFYFPWRVFSSFSSPFSLYALETQRPVTKRVLKSLLIASYLIIITIIIISWHEAVKVRSSDGFCLMKKLLEKFPEVAKVENKNYQ